MAAYMILVELPNAKKGDYEMLTEVLMDMGFEDRIFDTVKHKRNQLPKGCYRIEKPVPLEDAILMADKAAQSIGFDKAAVLGIEPKAIRWTKLTNRD